MKKIVAIGILIMMIGISTASEIRFSPDNGNIQKWCLIATDVVFDTTNTNVAATDVVIESSLEYVDFVPYRDPSKNSFPNFLPPQTGNNIVHIIWFVSSPNKTITGTWSMGTIFFKQKYPTDNDGAIRLYLKSTWDTTDTNLSILWWIDILDTVGSAYYRFVDTWTCTYPADYQITWWFAHMSAEESLHTTFANIQQQQNMDQLLSWKNLIPLVGAGILITLLFVVIKKRKQWTKK